MPNQAEQTSTARLDVSLWAFFTIGGATRFLPDAPALAEATTSLAQGGLGEVFVSVQAASLIAEDQWSFETERGEINNRRLSLQTWNRELEERAAKL